MKIQTVNQLISVFKDISTRHYQINGFGIGDNWENGASEAKMHPVLWINPTTATMPSTDNGYKTFEIDFEVRVFDLVNKDESNENEVLSDCIDILKDIITEFKGHPYYVNSQLNIIDDISFEAFTEEFDEEVSGWVCEISLMTPILTSFCGIPSADITGFEFPGIDCPNVNVLCPVFVEDVTGVYPIVVNTIGTTKEISIVGGATDTFVISGEYDNGTLTLTRNDDVDVVVTGFENDYTTAATLSGNIITFDRTDTSAAYSVDLTTAINSAPDKFVESGAFDNSNKLLTLTLNDLTDVDIDFSSLTTTDKFVQSGAYDEPNEKIVLTLNDASTVDIDTSAISGGGGGSVNTIYTANDSLTGDRTVSQDGNLLTYDLGTTSDSGDYGWNIDATNITGNKNSTTLSKITGRHGQYFQMGVDGDVQYRSYRDTGICSFLSGDGRQGLSLAPGSQISSFNVKFLQLREEAGDPFYTQFFHKNNQANFQMYSTGDTIEHQFNVQNASSFIQLFSDGIKGFGLMIGATTKLGTEQLSLQGSTAIKGQGTSTGSALSIYDNDTTPNKLWEFLDNGRVVNSINSANTSENEISNYGITLKNTDATDDNIQGIAFQDDSVNQQASIYARFGTKNSITFAIREDSASPFTDAFTYTNNAFNIFNNLSGSADGNESLTIEGQHLSSTIGSGARIGFKQTDSNNYGAYIKSYTFGAGNTGLGFATGYGTPTVKMTIDGNGKVNMSNLPTSSAGLSSGDLYSDGGNLKIV